MMSFVKPPSPSKERGSDLKREVWPLLNSPCCGEGDGATNNLPVMLDIAHYYIVVIYSSVK
jgi:hypothetical protein